MNRNDVIDAMKKAFEEANGYYMPYDGMEAALDAFLEMLPAYHESEREQAADDYREILAMKNNLK